jgi:hypothetical protein
VTAQLSNLEKLRAYAAAHPTDVQFVSEGIRRIAETEAYQALAQLSAKWRKRQDAARRAEVATRDQGPRTLIGIGQPREQPFLLTRRIRPPESAVRKVRVLGITLGTEVPAESPPLWGRK